MGDDVTTHGDGLKSERVGKERRGEGRGKGYTKWLNQMSEDLTPLSFPVPVFLLSNSLSAVLLLSAATRLLFKLAVHGQNTGSRDQTHCGQGTLGLLATAWVAIQVVTLHLSPNKNAFDVLMPYSHSHSHSQFSILFPIQHQTDNRNRIRIRIEKKEYDWDSNLLNQARKS